MRRSASSLVILIAIVYQPTSSKHVARGIASQSPPAVSGRLLRR
jgi:hypothetical protein